MEEMPTEVLDIVQLQGRPEFLDALALAALKRQSTLKLFTRYEQLFSDTCARWLEFTNERGWNGEVVQAFARILQLAPHLSIFLESCLAPAFQRPEHERNPSNDLLATVGNDVLELQKLLLSVWRLLNFDKDTYAPMVSGVRIQRYLKHEDRAVRYLALRIFCQILSAADYTMENMIEEHVGKNEAAIGDFDGCSVDFGFLSLLEGKRLQDAYKSRAVISINCAPLMSSLSSLVVRYGNVLLPRPQGQPKSPSRLVASPTTLANMENLAKGLLTSSPLLLHGLAGSGKTSLVTDLARELGMESDMVTLHLNEQTDAKMLIGMYATGATPGSFEWRAGVLATAVREGRWVFIEDLDRAPNEVISVILPLIERRELLIPSRGEVIKAGRGFRLLASIRTSLDITGHESSPTMHMLGARLWHRVFVQTPTQFELREIIKGVHPIVEQFLPGIMKVYERLLGSTRQANFASKSRTSHGRSINSRDLLKWCRRLENVLSEAGGRTGREPVNDATKYEMFLEATDCFASNLQNEKAQRALVVAIAEEMHIGPQQVEHFITSHVPRFDNDDRELRIGRARLRKQASKVMKKPRKSRVFANTIHVKRLLEQIGVAVKLAEPVLLVGETGIGKTTVVQELADTLGHTLTVVNLSQQSEAGDLLGGFKPVDVRTLAVPLRDEFNELFDLTGISATKNQRYLEQLGKCDAKAQWGRVSKLWREAPKMFNRILSEMHRRDFSDTLPGEHAAKRRKTESRLQALLELRPRWEKFTQNLDQFDIQLAGGSKGFSFKFIEGNIVKAARNGHWVLLDEINLASADTLESIAGLFQSGTGRSPSILLSDTGQMETIRAHPAFRIFGAMNPATDVGKRDLPIGLRSRFTEIFVRSPDRSLDDLLSVIKLYLNTATGADDRAAHDVARLYLNTKRLADDKRLVDGANQVPHFSLRTLTRILSYANEIASLYGLRRSLYEGFAMGFLTLLDKESERMLMPLIDHHLLGDHKNVRALLSQTPKHPENGKNYVSFMSAKKDRHYWLLQGMETLQVQTHYVRTPSVDRNILNLVRATSTRRFPVLVQGPTSSGKTSMIEYLAKHSGNKFVRINNHEHTDLQEYLGLYVSDSNGRLHFQDGLLVRALRQGHWIVLDELNLAPTEVLEALNRLLDDNRELLIPETQEVVRPHENFMLFATQNPPGLYGGRKTLSRAFRNRFLELHFDDIPEDELETILQTRCQNVAPSDCGRIVKVYQELSMLRQSNRLFEQNNSFATLRDLFRWALRSYENREELAANGYMLLAERVRNREERNAVKNVIEKVMKVEIDPTALYSSMLSHKSIAYDARSSSSGVVWTRAMCRLYCLVAQALRNNEPVLLVGETGCGKTTVCQMLADAFSKELHIVNAHLNTETGDLIGAQRPLRNRAAILEQLQQDLVVCLEGTDETIANTDLDALVAAFHASDPSSLPHDVRLRIQSGLIKSKALFEWVDGSLVQAMKEGQYFLLDEISLADDSVLERLNSVLETERTILLAEKGTEDSFIQATEGFQFFATMNPGGDYGKRELSPALRNRFTEIWVPALTEQDDVLQIVEAKLEAKHKLFTTTIVKFATWFSQNYRSSTSTSISVRDLLAWVKFLNIARTKNIYSDLLHGAAMVYIDTLGANPAALIAIDPSNVVREREKCVQYLCDLVKHDLKVVYRAELRLSSSDSQFTIGDFSLPRLAGSTLDRGFAFEAPTTKANAMRIIRALQIQKPILIEGNPGVGKTTLISALARACNRPLTRINLSEQTDLIDLFGSDVPVEGAEAGHFAWRDAPFLQAMQSGEWVLLDEMNLASQSVLEGLNACLDHRGEVYISELDQTFRRHPDFCVFAAQNPHHQGGGRKGLPASFVNRFTVVYADVFGPEDLELICKHNFPSIEKRVISLMIKFVSRLEHDISCSRRFGALGGPWEFNLRDILRWLQLINSKAPLLTAAKTSDFLQLIFEQRFRTMKDREEIRQLFEEVFNRSVPPRHFFQNRSSSAVQVGLAYTSRDPIIQPLSLPKIDHSKYLPAIESIMICAQQKLPCILVGPSGAGKTAVLQYVAAVCGKNIVTFSLNTDIDTTDLVGGFEQADPLRAASAYVEELKRFMQVKILGSLPGEVPSEAIHLLALLNSFRPSPSYFAKIAHHLARLEDITSLPEFEALLKTCKHFTETPLTPENARFEWVDGILINAMQRGMWLVLDNANLCSASVLDRLNSLLEPNGSLSVNEHCDHHGEALIIEPHADFRIFLTMDPRYGELSRAMRNRAVEIFLFPSFNVDNPDDPYIDLEAGMQRFKNVLGVIQPGVCYERQLSLLLSCSLDNLSWSDLPSLKRFISCLTPSSAKQEDFVCLFEPYMDLVHTPGNQSFKHIIQEMYTKLAEHDSLSMTGLKNAQTLHPLQNSPLVSLLQSYSLPVFWFAAVFEWNIGIFTAMKALDSQASSLLPLKPSKMSRLQRSLVKSRVSSVGNDSTANVADFLRSMLDKLQTFLRDFIPDNANWELWRRVIVKYLRYWWDTFDLVASADFNEATFNAHFTIGKDIASDVELPASNPLSFLIDAFASDLTMHFNSSFLLTTGQSMEIMWKHFRPAVASSKDTLDILLQLEDLSSKFDAVKWRTSISISDLDTFTASLTKAYQRILTSGADGSILLQTLQSTTAELETQGVLEEEGVTPFFQAEFEALRQLQLLTNMENDFARDQRSTTMVLANFPTILEMRIASSMPMYGVLGLIDRFWGVNGDISSLTGSFALKSLQKIDRLQEVALGSLKLLEFELPILGEEVANSCKQLCMDPFAGLNKTLLLLINDVVNLHGEYIAKDYTQWQWSISQINTKSHPYPQLDEQAKPGHTATPDHFKPIYAHHLKEATALILSPISDHDGHLRNTSRAWIRFALAFIMLYVPDQAFDPERKQKLARDRHIQTTEALRLRLNALETFEMMLTRQASNLQTEQLKLDIHEHGNPPDILCDVYRPDISQMDQLHGEFKILLKTVLGSGILEMVESVFNDDTLAVSQVTLLRENLHQMIRRFSERFRAYEDFTRPIISILRCLQLGISIALLHVPSRSSPSKLSMALGGVTPLLGGHNLMVDHSMTAHSPVDYLIRMATTSAVQNLSYFLSADKQAICKAFHECYESWLVRLDGDRAKAESNSGLYRFRGSAEDEDEDDEEEFNELFPAYDQDELPTNNRSPNMTRDTAIEISHIHADIFLNRLLPVESLTNLLKHTANRIGDITEDGKTSVMINANTKLLPGMLLLLDDKIDSLTTSAIVPDSYNFYTDANLHESRKLVALISKIRLRFRALQAVDEVGHMQPLADVLHACQDLLHFRHIEPLAKIITKLEQIHAYMHEWQFGGWASRANSALSLYNEVTQTIVSWRRLELSTWAKLFDIESQKCEDDAKSWWFVAYQVVIAAPLQMLDSKTELQVYAEKLLSELVAYLSTAILGQFLQRLRLLRHFQKHLEFMLSEYPAMSVIHSALSNFNSLYCRYEKPVSESLKRGRMVLEKSMRDVLLLASWKDTNIVALRDSAKRSHYKLFKIVRKYRALLGQSVESILRQGLPEESQPNDLATKRVRPVASPSVDASALALCISIVPNWSQKDMRFLNVSRTIDLMAVMATFPRSAIDGSQVIDLFLDNVTSTAAELQKATPSSLTEDNKGVVKHLKSQKRGLLARTLKELRLMGIKHNLATDALAKQLSLSTVLSRVGYLAHIDTQRLDYYFNKAIDLIPAAREAARQHSEDLTGAEVTRSMGFLEGLLQLLITQRSMLSIATIGVAKLKTTIVMAQGLWAPNAYSVRHKEKQTDHEKVLLWLPAILSVARDVVRVHGKLGKVDSKLVLEKLLFYVEHFDTYQRQWASLPVLPSEFCSTVQLKLEKDVEASTLKLSLDLQEMIKERPDLDFVLNHIDPWLQISHSVKRPTQQRRKNLSDLDARLSSVCNLALVAVQNYKGAITALSSSSNDFEWLIKNEKILRNSISCLHCEDVINSMKQTFDVLRDIDLDDEVNQNAGALYGVVLPIIEQYSTILHEAVTRYSELHRAICKATFTLSKFFIQVASQGFCTPSEQSESQDGKTEKLEGGTGLGDGEGAEDISKDIEEDEDLDELAQEPTTGDKSEIEHEQDAVDMADAEMEGVLGDSEQKGEDDNGSGDDKSVDETDEEAGSVDDLDPTAVDEKMWDGDGDEAEKVQEGDKAKGKESKEEQAAGQDHEEDTAIGNEADNVDDEEEPVGAEQGEEVKQDSIEPHDPYTNESDALDLPDDMELDGNVDEKSMSGNEDDMNDLSDVDKEEDPAKDGDEENDGTQDVDTEEMQEPYSEMDDVVPDVDQDDGGEETNVAGEKEKDGVDDRLVNQENLLQDRNDDANFDADNAALSDVQGLGDDQDESINENTDTTSSAQREDGGKGDSKSETKVDAIQDGQPGRQASGEDPQDARSDTQDNAEMQAFKRLGDALEQWHRQQTNIRQPIEIQKHSGEPDINLAKDSTDFQHLQDDEARPDTQALGTATEEQAHALDESMAIESEDKEMPDQFPPTEVEDDDIGPDSRGDDDATVRENERYAGANESRAGAMIKQSIGNFDANEPGVEMNLDIEAIEDVDDQLKSTHLENDIAESRSFEEARKQWTHHEDITRDLSLSLTEQLRLVLAPTLATKMRGDFRTGKRLNIKRIIPYIASQYKRDKIWMRRSIPSKRSYQIMLAVDDSKSMGESGSGSLAFETLVMISKSLNMLEVGEICVVSFGQQVKIAHDFATPFGSDAGPRTLQNFTFQQNRTDVAKLVRDSINLFRGARARSNSSSHVDTWQMELIISDGVCESRDHDEIRRLLREAMEERIMIVFVIVDDVKKKGGQSVLDLNQATFVNGTVVTSRYLDTFPFQYYIVVSDVRELPGVLATLLRQWFAEVVDSSN